MAAVHLAFYKSQQNSALSGFLQKPAKQRIKGDGCAIPHNPLTCQLR